jgi:hypothetical protein
MPNTAAASRVAGTIGVFKWVIIATQVLFGVILLLVFNAQHDWPTWTAAAGPIALVASLLSALFTWVLFGWFQHTLGMLSAIAANTRQTELGVEWSTVKT